MSKGELDAAIAVLEASGTAAQVYDEEGRLRWVSGELMRLAGAEEGEDVGIGLRPVDADLEVDGRAWRQVLGDAAFTTLMSEISARLDPAAEHPSLWLREAPLALLGRRLSVGMPGVTVRRSGARRPALPDPGRAGPGDQGRTRRGLRPCERCSVPWHGTALT